MENSQKQTLIFLINITLGIIIVFSGLTNLLHRLVYNATYPLVVSYGGDTATKAARLSAYVIELVIVVIIMLSPFAGISGVWLCKIAFELTFGSDAYNKVFMIAQSLNVVMAVLCIILAVYCLILQNRWAYDYVNKVLKKADVKDLTRFI